MDTPPHLKGPLTAVPIADDTVWVTKDGAWVIVARRTWDARASASPAAPPPAAPARKRPTTDDDMGLVMGTGSAMPAPRPPPPPRAAVHTEPVWVDSSHDTARLGLFAAGGVLLVALVLAVGVVTGMSLSAGATPEPVPVLQPVELTTPPVATSGSRFRTPPAPPVDIPDVVDTGDALATVAGSTVPLGRLVDDEDVSDATPRFVIPALPPLPPGDKPRWVQRLATGWRALEAHPDRAVKQFRRVAAARPRLADAQLGLGVAFVRLGQPAEAVPRLCAAAGDPVLAAAANGALDALGARCPQDR